MKFHKLPPEENIEYIFQEVQGYIKSYSLHPNDIVILSSKINIIRRLNEFWLQHEKTHTMFETMQELSELTRVDKDKLIKMSDVEIDQLISSHKEVVEQARRRKKNHFYQNSGLIKISSTHSFKGLESKTVFCIVNEQDSPEIIYTGITRAINNLIIFDLTQSKKYMSFFEAEVRS